MLSVIYFSSLLIIKYFSKCITKILSRKVLIRKWIKKTQDGLHNDIASNIKLLFSSQTVEADHMNEFHFNSNKYHINKNIIFIYISQTLITKLFFCKIEIQVCVLSQSCMPRNSPGFISNVFVICAVFCSWLYPEGSKRASPIVRECLTEHLPT